VSRPRVEVAVPALALRRAEAAAALGVSVETFDAHVRPHVAHVQVGNVMVYPRVELERFLAQNARADATIGAPIDAGPRRCSGRAPVHQEVP
jgi:hypothetical protein